MNKRILLVDDEQHILDGMKRNLRKKYDVTISLGGKLALEILHAEEEPFSVIMSDMRMPELDGVEFLSQAKVIAPETVRLMLTGNADQETAVKAVNGGEVFRFLNKPCDQQILESVLDQAVRQYQLITAEKDILQRTVRGSIEALVEVMSLTSPLAFGRVKRIQYRCREIAKKMLVQNLWEMDAAALLSQLGCVTVPEKILKIVFSGGEISADERNLYLGHAKKGYELIKKIPRLENVAKIVYLQFKNFDGSGFPKLDLCGENIPLKSRILRVVLAFEEMISAGWPEDAAFQELMKTKSYFDPAVLEMLVGTIQKSVESKVSKVSVDTLINGMILNEDLSSDKGVLLACRGLEINSLIKERIHNYRINGSLTAKLVLVSIPKNIGEKSTQNRIILQ